MKSNLSQVFERIRSGDKAAEDRLFMVVYSELHQIASAERRRCRPNHTLQSGDLVHAAYLKLASGEGKALSRNRAYFFAAAARAMRQVIIDYDRKWRPPRTSTTAITVAARSSHDGVDIHALDQALTELAEQEGTLAEIVELRIFAGLTIEQVAEVCGIGTATVSRKFRVARAFLRSRIEEHNGDSDDHSTCPRDP